MSQYPHECLVCEHLIDWDEKLGWFHEEHDVFDHDAVADWPTLIDGSGAT